MQSILASHHPIPQYFLHCCLLDGAPQQTSFKGNISKVFIGIHGGFIEIMDLREIQGTLGRINHVFKRT